MKRKMTLLFAVLLCISLTACFFSAAKTDGIMADLYEAGYIEEYDKGEKIVKYDGVVPSKQVYYEYPIRDSEANQVYRIYFDEEDSSKFEFYDRDRRIRYLFQMNDDGELRELERYNY